MQEHPSPELARKSHPVLKEQSCHLLAARAAKVPVCLNVNNHRFEHERKTN